MNVNDEAAPIAVKPSISAGNALLREAIHAKYSVSYVTIPAATLKAGDNTITLTVAPLKWDGDHAMYDYINLELP